MVSQQDACFRELLSFGLLQVRLRFYFIMTTREQDVALNTILLRRFFMANLGIAEIYIVRRTYCTTVVRECIGILIRLKRAFATVPPHNLFVIPKY